MQKTAYDMRISGWSSDVCSSVRPAEGSPEVPAARFEGLVRLLRAQPAQHQDGGLDPAAGRFQRPARLLLRAAGQLPQHAFGAHHQLPVARLTRQRSEEHTSELQSLMRISYAVFCFKKKKKHPTDTHQHPT